MTNQTTTTWIIMASRLFTPSIVYRAILPPFALWIIHLFTNRVIRSPSSSPRTLYFSPFNDSSAFIRFHFHMPKLVFWSFMGFLSAHLSLHMTTRHRVRNQKGEGETNKTKRRNSTKNIVCLRMVSISISYVIHFLSFQIEYYASENIDIDNTRRVLHEQIYPHTSK